MKRFILSLIVSLGLLITSLDTEAKSIYHAYHFLYLGKVDKAIQLHSKLRNKFGPHPVLTQLLGHIHFTSGRYREAEAVYKRGFRELPKKVHPWIWNNVGNIYLKQGKRKSAIQAYANALQLDPRYERARFNLEKLQKKQKPKKRPNRPPPPRRKKRKRRRKKRRKKKPPKRRKRSKKRPKAMNDNRLKLRDYDRFLPLHILRKLNRNKQKQN